MPGVYEKHKTNWYTPNNRCVRLIQVLLKWTLASVESASPSSVKCAIMKISENIFDDEYGTSHESNITHNTLMHIHSRLVVALFPTGMR